MRSIRLRIAHFLLFSYCCGYQVALATITFFIRPFPQKGIAASEADNEKLLQSFKYPGRVSGKTVKKKFLANGRHEGIFGSHLGYLALSNFNGQITFPRKMQTTSFVLVVTPRIKPVPMLDNTIHHWELEERQPVALYTVERKQDPDTKLWFWDVASMEQPKDKVIQINYITLFAKPKNIYVPEGITLTEKRPQLILPDVYAKKGLNIAARALWILNFKHYFAPVHSAFKKESDTYFSEQIDIR